MDLYRESGRRAQDIPEKLKVGLHSLGYVAENSKKAVEDYFPGYAKTFKNWQRKGLANVTFERFKDQNGPLGALMIGSAEETAEKILRHTVSLVEFQDLLFRWDNAELSQKQLFKV